MALCISSWICEAFLLILVSLLIVGVELIHLYIVLSEKNCQLAECS
ncbi:hypothetical protein LOK49_Contig107G00003 [Camellia lanceoleosa]|nr:hypothetical protein LOK49_Contig107G00003 [Camellia lanceoleosa]